MKKIITAEEAAALVKEGNKILIGGFLAVGTPDTIIDALVRSNVQDLTVVCNDSGTDKGVAKLIANKQVSKLQASFIGSNRESGRQMTAGEMEIELIPQGTLVERIRCGGVGIGGFFTPTGIGTVVAEGKEVRVIDGKEMVFETPIRGEIAYIRAFIADKHGNLRYHATATNFNPIMALAADTVIVEVDNLVDFMDPDDVETPGVLIDFIVRRGR